MPNTIADIDREIGEILTAYDGEDVRGSLVSALRAMNENTNGICTQAVTDAQNAAESASGSASNAADSQAAAHTDAQAAASSAQDAAASAQAAANSAQQAATGGVRSFNGRNPAAQTGDIAPEAGDYTSAMIYHNDSGTKTVKSELDTLNDWILNGLAVTTVSLGTIAIAANGSVSYNDKEGTISGKWKAVGCVGYSNNKNYIILWKSLVKSTTVASSESGASSVTLEVGYTNTSNSAVNITPGIRVLWAKVP